VAPVDATDRRALAALLANGVLAGGNAVAVRFSNRELAPLWGAGLRFGLAAALLALVMAGLRLELPRGRALRGVLIFGLLNFAGAFALGYYALVRLHAGFGQILLSLVPLTTLLLAVVHGQERLRPAAALGTLLSLAGVAVMSGVSLQGSVPLLSILASLGATVCFAEAAVLARRFPRVHPVTMNALAMGVGAAVLIAAALAVGDPIALPREAATWAALAYLVPVGSVLVFLLYVVVLRYWAASRAAYVFVLLPAVSLALSSWLDDEPVGPSLVFGGLLVLLGVYVGALRGTAPVRLATQECGPGPPCS